MNISFSPSRPVAADTLAFVIGKDELNHLPLSASKTVMDGARACRFNGEAAALFETFVAEGDKTVRVLLVGTGMGSPGDFERAGATISAKRSEEPTSDFQSLMRTSYAVFGMKNKKLTL